MDPNGQSVTTLWRSLRPSKEDRVAKLKWAANGGLGRIIIGKVNFHRILMPLTVVDISLPEHSADVRPRQARS